ncbi:unnamed protein product [Fraxinus pennsylvanica]|uniref:Uncharacterized protein n=1 Tax=Fraxinus pennsylvanica TaxID=56036 RepID=A0AAD2DG29_9LAMI|nr:unnamed protein product [Fraxinus pennsylvanica]
MAVADLEEGVPDSTSMDVCRKERIDVHDHGCLRHVPCYHHDERKNSDYGVMLFFRNLEIGSLDISDYLAIGAIFAATDSVCTLQACFCNFAFVAETFIFLYFGMDALDIEKWSPGTSVAKSRNEHFTFREQVIIWWAGLMRGAVYMALAYNKSSSAASSGPNTLRTVIVPLIGHQQDSEADLGDDLLVYECF